MAIPVSVITGLLESWGITEIDTYLAPIVKSYYILNPGMSTNDLVNLISGQMKHIVRTKISWGADLLWPFVSSYVNAEVNKVLMTIETSVITPPTPAVEENAPA